MALQVNIPNRLVAGLADRLYRKHVERSVDRPQVTGWLHAARERDGKLDLLLGPYPEDDEAAQVHSVPLNEATGFYLSEHLAREVLALMGQGAPEPHNPAVPSGRLPSVAVTDSPATEGP